MHEVKKTISPGRDGAINSTIRTFTFCCIYFGTRGTRTYERPPQQTKTRLTHVIMSDVTDLVEKSKVFALNESVAGSHSHLWNGDRSNAVLSNADATLIVFVPFRESVRLSAIIIDAPPSLAPSSVRLFVNAKALGFDDVETTEPAALILVGEGDLGSPIKLRPSKFNAVNELFIYIEREGAEKVSISKIAFIGAAMQSTDVSKIKGC